ncbi:MOB kinase activator 2-like [Kogia breviceps]|uniref:MOB kinase activator 2-like n=1 Tax=Kogia breviceps TaxID=27615 RepID=UPI0034D1A443
MKYLTSLKKLHLFGNKIHRFASGVCATGSSMLDIGCGGPMQPWTGSWGRLKAKPNHEKPVGEKKRYLEAEYTKSRITDFEFKVLVVLPERSTSTRGWRATPQRSPRRPRAGWGSQAFCMGEGCQTMVMGHTQCYRHKEQEERQVHSPLVRRLCLELPAEAGDPRGPVPHEMQQRIPQLLPVACEEDQQVAVSCTSAHLLLPLQGDSGSGIELNTLYVHFTLFARELWAMLDGKGSIIQGQVQNVGSSKMLMRDLRLKSLTYLSINHNQLASIPRELCFLENLSELQLNYNQLICIPKEINFLKKLQKLLLVRNNIESLPENKDQRCM